MSDPSTPARRVSFAYDTAGDLTDYTDAGGAKWHFTYDAHHRLETMRRPRHAEAADPPVTRNVYESPPSKRVLSQTDELNRTHHFDYAAIPNSTKVTDPKGNLTVVAYRDYMTTGWGTKDEATGSSRPTGPAG